MLTLTDVVHFLSNKFTCLSARGLSFTLILSCSFKGFFFRHDDLLAICFRAWHSATHIFVAICIPDVVWNFVGFFGMSEVIWCLDMQRKSYRIEQMFSCSFRVT